VKVGTVDPSWRQNMAADRRRRTREKLIAAAARVVAEAGEHKARIDDVIAAAGVARGTFYNYYSTLEALFEDVWAHVGRKPFQEIQLSTQHIADPAARLAAGAQLVLERAAQDHTWGWVVFAFSAAGAVPEDLLSYPKPDLVAGHRSGRLKFSDLDSASDLIIGALRSALQGILTQGRSMDYATEVVSLLLRAIGITEGDVKSIIEQQPLRVPTVGQKNPAQPVRATAMLAGSLPRRPL
jgi:AcrR family transcriptional regulator